MDFVSWHGQVNLAAKETSDKVGRTAESISGTFDDIAGCRKFETAELRAACVRERQ